MADRLTEIEARANAATDAPWVHREHETGVWMGEWFGLICRTDTGNRARPDDAAFIAHARDDIPWLLARVRDLEAARKWYRDHVTEDGFYDESMWGDPFAISPQLRAALAPAEERE